MWVRMQSVAEARQWLEAGLLYENLSDPERPRWHVCDEVSPQQLNRLELEGDDYNGDWPIEDYAIYIEE